YVIEFDYETKKLFGEMQTGRAHQPDVNPWDKIHMLTTALRLFKSGIIGIDTIKTEQILDVPIIVSGTSSYMHGSYIGPKYYLIKAEVDDFKRFRKDFNKIDLNSLDYIRVAVRRFNYAYERGNLEDKLIDFMVAFEALFFKQGEFGEFRHKLSVRVSRFLEQDYNKRRLIAKDMGDFYEARSQIVHGEKVELKHDLVKTVEDQLRRSIKLFFESLQKSDHDEIISHLDLD
ncbi:MAG TPA: hypothetical protein VJ343_02755, partial [archaeon]|nr:hypothetical protein [archaeon]